MSSEFRWVVWAALGVVVLSALPYFLVERATPAELRFAGALINPLDAQSYLAKMRQGDDGGWLFRLPFSANDQPDAFLFTYHLGLGHLARLSGLPLVTVYHLARLAGGWLLLVVVYAWLARAFDSPADRRRAWWFVALTSGLGWLGLASTDVTIPESNTFFSILANAHFALSVTLMLIALLAVLDAVWWRAALAALGLAVLQPFAPIAVFAALGAFLLLRWLRPASSPQETKRTFPLRQAAVALVAGLSITPLMLYFYFVTQNDPQLRLWSAQNLTPSPSPLEYLAGYGLLGLLAVPGVRAAWRRGRDVDLLLAGWAATSLLLLYAPFPLQRRFALGLHVPIVSLGLMGLASALGTAPRVWQRWLPRLVFGVSLLTTLTLLIATSSAASRQPDGRLFFSASEAAAFDWLRANAPHTAVVLAAPETGLFLPAWADVRVVYGHPFETIDAAATKAKVERFFSGAIDRAEVLGEYNVEYIFFGPRERRLGAPAKDWPEAFTAGDVVIYQTHLSAP